jgi:tetratricopeptide (TPR) repeat protein
MNHFPLVFIIFILNSCEKETKTNAPSSLTYTDYIEKANNKVSTLELDSAYFYFNQAKLSCKDNEKEMKIYALLGMANIQKTNCDFVGLEETATEAFGIDNETNYKEYLNNFLGIAYNEQADYENALLYYNKTLDNSKNETNRLTIKNNIAVNYLDQKEYVKSIDVLEKLLKGSSII